MAARSCPEAAAGTAAAVVVEALSWVGTPYRHQAAQKGVGCDCLGLVRGVWRALYGSELERPGATRRTGPRLAARSGCWRA